MTKISELDPLHEFTPTLDLIPVVHAGKTYSMRVSDFQISAEGSTFLPTTGGYLTGPLYLYDLPTFPNEAATKGYVDSHVQAGGPFLPISGGQMLGNLSLVGDPQESLDAASKSYVDSLMAATASGGVTVMEYTIKTVIASGDPGTGAINFNVSNQSDATALYIDQVSNAGRDWTLLLMALKVGQKVSIQPLGDHNRVARWTIAAPSEDMSGYTILHVTPVSATGFPLPNNTTVAIAIQGDTVAEFLPLSGGTMQGGISFGQRFGGSSTDLTQHISLFDGWGGFNITGGSLNVVAGSNNVLSSDGNWLYAKVPIYLPRTPIDPWEAAPKNYIDTNFAPIANGGYVMKTGDQMSGALYITSDTDATIRVIGTGGDWPAVKWNTTTATSAAGYFESQRYGKPRWSIEFGTGGGEPGGNVGTDYIMNRFDDDGNWISPTPFVIRRGTGAIETYTPLYLMGDPTTGLQAVPMRWVTNNYSTNTQGDLRWVNVTGDTMSGALTIGAGVNNALTITPGATGADTITLAQSGTAGIRLPTIRVTAASAPLVVTDTAELPSIGAAGGTLIRFLGSAGSNVSLTFDAFGSGGAGGTAFFTGRGAQGSASAPSAMLANGTLVMLRGQGFGATSYGTGATIAMQAAQAWTDAARGAYMTFSTAPLGTNTVTERLRIDASGIVLIGQTATVGTALLQVNGGLSLTNGDATLFRDPTANLHAVPKQWLDNNYSTNTQGDLRWVNVTGDGMTGGLGFGNATVGLAQDTSRHITLYDGFAGFSVTGGTLNIVSNWDTHFVDMNGVVTLSLNNAGDLELKRDPVFPMHAVNRGWIETNYLTIDQSDARYVNVTGDTMSGALTIGAGASNALTITPGAGAASPVMLGMNGTGPLIAYVTKQTAPLMVHDRDNLTYGIPVIPPQPNTVLHLQGQLNDNVRLQLNAHGGAPVINGIATGGFVGGVVNPTGTNRNLIVIGGGGYDGTAYSGGRAQMIAAANEAWTPTANGTRWIFTTTANGTTATVERMRIADTGIVMIGQTVPLNAAKLQVNGGVSLGEFQVAGDYDLSRHLLIYDGGGQHTYGLNVQWNGVNPAHFNYVAGLDGVHQFLIQGTGLIATFQPAGLLMNSGISFGGAITGNNNTDLTKHISLYPNHGINVSYRGLNIVAGASYFINDSITTVALSSTVVSMYVGLSFGGDTTPSGRPTDLSRHLDLFGGSYGLSITNNRLNIVSPGWTYFNVGGNDIGRFDATGLTFDGFYTVTLGREPTTDMEAATRKYADGVLDRAGGPFLPLTAGSGMALTGMLYLPHTTPTVDEHATPLFYVRNADQVLQDQISAVAAGNLVFFGQLHMNPAGTRDEVFYKTMLNLPNGPLPDPTTLVKGSYFIVVEAGIPPASGTHIPPMPAGTSQYVRGDWFISDGEDWIFLPLGLVYFTASAVAVDPPVQGTYNVQDTLQWFDANDLKLAGGTMKGHLYLDGIPTTGTQAASKDYVDNKAFLKLTGGTMLGGISFGQNGVSNPTDTSQHITLWQPGLGFSVTPYRMNYVVDVLTSHYFLVGGADVMAIDTSGLNMKTGYDIYLARPPTLDMQAVNKKYVDDQMSGYLKLTGGNMTGDILMTGLTRVNFFNGSMFIGQTGLDRADIMGANLEIGSWHGIGFPTTCPGQLIPHGFMSGVTIGTREGYLEGVRLAITDGRPYSSTQIQMMSIYHDNTPNQIIETNVNCYKPTIASIVNGGGSVNVNDRFRDDYGNTYTAMATSGGQVTTLRLDNARATLYGAPANPVALYAVSGSAAFNVSVNLTWTRPNFLILQHTYGSVALYGSNHVEINGGAGGTYVYQPLRPKNGINFDSAVSGNPQDTSVGITFYGPSTGPNYGIVVTGSTLNYNTYGADNQHDFYSGGSLLFRMKGGDRVTSYLPLAASQYIQIDATGGGSARLNLNHLGGASEIWGFNNYRARWMISLANSDEGGDTTGTNGSAFALHAYGNDGHYVGNPMFIIRAEGRGGDVSFSGYVYVSQDPWQPTSVVIKRWLEANYLSTVQGDARWVNADGDTMTGSLTIQQNLDVRGQLAANGDFVFTARHNGDPIPSSGGGWLLWNSSGGWGEVNFVNGCSWAPAGFDWKQVTGAGTWATLMTMRNDAILRISGVGITYGVPNGGNAMGFSWNGGWINAYVDNNLIGKLTTSDFVAGNYLALTGGIVHGETTIDGQFNVHNYAAAKYFSVMPNLAGGAYNSIVQTGDHAILVSAGAPDTGVLTLMPWSNAALGIRIDGAQRNVAVHAPSGIYFYGMTLHNNGIAWSTQGGDFRPGSIYTDPNWGGLFRGHPGVNSDLAFADRAGTSVIYVRYPGLVTIDGATTFGSSVTLNKDPAQPMEAATRQYVDAVRTSLGDYLPRSGGTMFNGGSAIRWTGQGIQSIGEGIDGAGTTNNNLRISSWYGIGFYSTLPGDDGNIARIWFNVRDGSGHFSALIADNLYIGGGTTLHNTSVAGTLRVDYTPTDTSAQLWLTPTNGNDGQSKIRFGATFASPIADGGPRYVASLRAGLTGGWGTEYLDVYLNNQMNDTNSDANQSQIARFTREGLSVSGYSWASGNVGGNAVVSNSGQFIMANNAAYFFERVNGTGDWRFVEGNNTIFKVDAAGSATIYGNATFNGYSTFLNQPTVKGTNPQLNLDGPANSWRTIQWFSSGAPRWNIQAEYSNEPGGNVGSDLLFTRWLDNGTPGAIAKFERSTGRLLLMGATSDPLYISAPQGMNARIFSTVSNIKTWSAGTFNDGSYAFGDENRQRFVLTLDGSNGNATLDASLLIPNGGLNFGNRTGGGPTDLTQHIQLWAPNYGFSITGGTLNIVAGGTISSYPNGTIVTAVNDTGLQMWKGDVILFRDPSAAMHATTKQYTDAKYVPIAGGNYVAKTGDTMTGSLTVNPDITASGAMYAGVFSSVQANGYPQFRWTNTAAGVNLKKLVAFISPAGDFTMQFENDASSQAAAFLQATRSGYAVATVTLTAPNIYLSGVTRANDIYSPVYRFTNTGGYIYGDTNVTQFIQDSGMWRWEYARATGQLTWMQGGTNLTLFQVTPNGALWNNDYHSVGGNGIIYRGFTGNAIAFNWDSANTCINQYIDGSWQGTVATRGWAGATFKGIGAYTPNQVVDYGSGPVFGGVTITGDAVTHNVFCDGSVGIKYRAYSNVFTAFGWNGRVQCWLDGGGAYVELRDTRDYMPNQNVDVSAGPTFSIVWLNNNGIVYSPWNGSAVALPWDGYSLSFKLDGGDRGRLLRSFDTGGGWTGCHQLMLNGNGTCGIWWPDNNFAGWTIVWSDRRLKSNIRPATIDALGLINRLTVHELDLLPPVPHAVSQHWDCALIADEVEEVIPLAVVNYEEGEGYAQIREMPLIATMARAIQQLTEQNVALMARMEQLEQRMH